MKQKFCHSFGVLFKTKQVAGGRLLILVTRKRRSEADDDEDDDEGLLMVTFTLIKCIKRPEIRGT